MQNAVSLVIQGPFHENCLDSIDNYRKFVKEVILSCYENEKHFIPADVFDKVVFNKNPEYPIYRGQNTFFQAYTTLNGLYQSSYPFSIKVRTDEKYENIGPIVDKIFDRPNALITNNITFVPAKHTKYHPCDHVMGGKTENLLKMCSLTTEVCKKYTSALHNFPTKEMGIDIGDVTSEVVMCMNYLFGLGLREEMKDISLENVRKIMRENIDVVPIEQMGECLWTCMWGPRRMFYRNCENVYGHENEPIRKIEEV